MVNMSRSGDRSYRRGVGFYQIRGRDREIAPTAIRDGEYVAIGRSLLQKRGWFLWGIRGRDREIAPTEEGLGIK